MKRGIAFEVRKVLEVPDGASEEDITKLVDAQLEALEGQGWVVEVLDDDFDEDDYDDGHDRDEEGDWDDDDDDF